MLFEISHEYKDSGAFTKHDFHGAHVMSVSREQDFSSTARDWGGKESLGGRGTTEELAWIRLLEEVLHHKQGDELSIKWCKFFSNSRYTPEN